MADVGERATKRARLGESAGADTSPGEHREHVEQGQREQSGESIGGSEEEGLQEGEEEEEKEKDVSEAEKALLKDEPPPATYNGEV